jgi:PAS domain S-box-containing protein
MTKLKSERLAEVTIQPQWAVETLPENLVLFAGILSIADEAIISVDETYHIFLFNQGAARIFGYTSKEALGQPLDLLLPERFVAVHRRHIADFAASTVTARLMGERQEIFGRRKNGQEFPAEASISRLEIDGRPFFTVILRDVTERKQAEAEREKLIAELQALNEAAQAITCELSLEPVLQKIAQVARTLLKARYAALGIHGERGMLSRFITAGISPAEQARIGLLPIGQGLLGLLLRQGQSLIVNDIARHPARGGFPAHHPNMHKLLGVPIFSKSALIGGLYLADKADGSDFMAADQQVIETLALHAAIAIENARLYEKAEQVVTLEERERFARDLHDGIIQSIYGVGLSLENMKADLTPTEEPLRAQINLSLKSLATVITDLRGYIFDLRPQALNQQGLSTRLAELIQEIQANTSLVIEAEVDPNIGAYLSEQQADHIFHICHEALSNVVRHAKARHIYLGLTQAGDTVSLRVEDDGIGFEPSSPANPGHYGLANLRARVAQLNGVLDLDSAPQQGTRLRVTFRSALSA